MSEEYETETTPRSYTRGEYRGMLNYEGILGGHITRLMQYRDNNPKQYCSGIETLIMHCPRAVRKKTLKKLKDLGLNLRAYAGRDGLNEQKLLIYDDLLMYINEQLENANLIFRTGRFEIGHD
jgi:hypothetical protein